MLTRLFPFLDPARITPDLSLRLRALADDGDRLVRGLGVFPFVLQAALILENWVAVTTPEEVRLAGYATGHPVHHDRFVMTTQIWLADPIGTWVRGLSRFYPLGRRGHSDEIRRILTGRRANSGYGSENVA
jgi:hypothetical protein